MSPSLSTVALLADPWNVSLVLTGVSLRVYCISRGYCIVVQRNSKQNLNTTGSNSKISIDEQWKEVTHATFFSFSMYLIRLLRQLWYDEHGSELKNLFAGWALSLFIQLLLTHTHSSVLSSTSKAVTIFWWATLMPSWTIRMSHWRASKLTVEF
jgi:hypothetical protein